MDYRYALINRPACMGAVPSGPFRIEPRPPEGADHHEHARHGIVVYDRPLSDEEIYGYELAPIVDGEDRLALAEQIAADYPTDYLDDFLALQEDEFGLFEEELAGVLSKRYKKTRVPSFGSFQAFAKVVFNQLQQRARS